MMKAVCFGFLLASGVCYSADHHYRLSFTEMFDRVSVEAHLAVGVSSLVARNGDVALLESLTDCDGISLSTRRGHIRLDATERLRTEQTVRCVRYGYPLREPSRRVVLAEGVSVSSPSEWLWIPRLGEGDQIRIDLELPEATSVSVPWNTLESQVFLLLPSPQSSRSNVILGGFRERTLTLPGAELRVALLDGPDKRLSEEKILSWLDAAARDVAGVYGRFPNPNPQIIVMASGDQRRGGRSAVPFGHVIRDGGETVRFFVNGEMPLDDYLGDWTATHEFAHLLLPYIEGNQKWISEGFASYYQNVLLARRGVYSEEEAWRRLHRSFNRARAIKNPPSPNNTGNHPFWEVRMLVYWSGAAIALLADVELREMSDGKVSLDTVLGRLQECCLPSHREWRGRAFFSKLDELTEYKVFARLYAEHANSRGMPDLTTLYSDLGIVPKGDKVTLLDRARLVHIRRNIMDLKEITENAGF